MKKTGLFIIILLLIGMNSCKDKDPDLNHGSVTLNPARIELTYGQKDTISYSFSADGLASGKKYQWGDDYDKNIVSTVVITGNKMEITAKRIGKTNISIYALDGTISAYSEVEINSRTNFLSHIYFNPGVDKQVVRNKVQGELNVAESTENFWVYDINGKKIRQEIYYFQNNKLFSTIVVLENTPETLAEAEQFLEERFVYLNKFGAENIKYYAAGVYPDYASNVLVGIVQPSVKTIPEGTEGKLCVKFTTEENI